MEKVKSIKLLGFPLPGFLVLFAGVMAIALSGGMLGNMVGALGFAMIWGAFIGWIGDRIPIWNNWLGG